MKKSILVLATVFLFSSFFTSCRDESNEKHEMEMSDDMDRMGDDLEDAADDTGDAIKKAADKTGKAIEKTAKKVGDKLEGDDN